MGLSMTTPESGKRRKLQIQKADTRQKYTQRHEQSKKVQENINPEQMEEQCVNNKQGELREELQMRDIEIESRVARENQSQVRRTQLPMQKVSVESHQSNNQIANESASPVRNHETIINSSPKHYNEPQSRGQLYSRKIKKHIATEPASNQLQLNQNKTIDNQNFHCKSIKMEKMKPDLVFEEKVELQRLEFDVETNHVTRYQKQTHRRLVHF